MRSPGKLHLIFMFIVLAAFLSFQLVSDWKDQSRKLHVVKVKQSQNLSWTQLVERRQEDEQLIQYIHKQMRSRPSNHNRVKYYKWTDVMLVLDATELLEKRNGFFVEVEANDGIKGSHSVHWETNRNWNGLLIEANETNFNKLEKSGRRTFMLKGCLCRTEWTEKMYYRSGSYFGVPNTELPEAIEMLCYPFYSVMVALNVKTIDMMILNVAGWELDVLQTIPLEKLNVEVFVVEYRSLESFQHLQSYMESHDYNTFCRLKRSGIFTKKQLLWSKAANETGYPKDRCLFTYKFNVH